MASSLFWFQANIPAASKLLLAFFFFLSEDCAIGVVAGEGEPNKGHAGINCSLRTAYYSIQELAANGI